MDTIDPGTLATATPEERRQSTLAAIPGKRTSLPVWANVDDWNHALLEKRAVAAAKYIAPGTKVLDVGCAAMLIERHLPAGCSYQPLDCVARDARTIVCDLNRDPFPAIKADVALVLGVVEYLYNVPIFLTRLRKAAPRAIISYFPLDRDPGRDRIAMRWVNALNSNELRALLRYAGYKKIEVIHYAPRLFFYLVET
jgi:hypothetical protein